MIIGLSGFARAGKDEVAKRLVEMHGFTRIAFADKMRDFAYALNPIVGSETFDLEVTVDETQVIKKYSETEVVRLQDVIDEFGWEGYKETNYSDEIRGLLQRLGTEAGRDLLGKNVWVDATLKDVDPWTDHVVISDARFLNEFKAITDMDGYMVRIDRPGIGPANDHASENEALQYMGKFDYAIYNDGTIEDLYAYVDKLVRGILR